MKINVGCGPYKKVGYINIDKNPVWAPDIVCDVRLGLPYNDNSIEEVRNYHFIEHLDKDEIIAFLAECYRVLKPGGILDMLYPLGLTPGLDHKSYLWESTFDPILGSGSEGERDEFHFGPRIAFKLISKTKSKTDRCEMLTIKAEVKK